MMKSVCEITLSKKKEKSLNEKSPSTEWHAANARRKRILRRAKKLFSPERLKIFNAMQSCMEHLFTTDAMSAMRFAMKKMCFFFFLLLQFLLLKILFSHELHFCSQKCFELPKNNVWVCCERVVE